MSINNFTDVALSDGKLVANAERKSSPGGPHLNAGPGVEAYVTAILVDDDEKRCALVVHNAETSPWSAESADDHHGFTDGDEIYLVGSLALPNGPPFLWCQELTVGALAKKHTP